jgi:hypothetical protein
MVFEPWSRNATRLTDCGGEGAGGEAVDGAVTTTLRFANCQVFCEFFVDPPDIPTRLPPCGGWPLMITICLSLTYAVAAPPLVTTRNLFTCPTPLFIAAFSVQFTGVSH